MIYFADLTPYSYHGADEDDRFVNVGWLSAGHEFPRGFAPQGLVEQLDQLITMPVNISRDVHICEFCPPAKAFAGKSGLQIRESDPERHGNGEIRVTGHHGVTYVAPVLIRHYVSEHEYLPPQPFIDAVLGDH